MKRVLILSVLLLVPVFVFSEALYSPTWGFRLDLPEGFEYAEGDGKDRFSFNGPDGIILDIVVYNGIYRSVKELVNDINKKITNKGNSDFFTYGTKQAAVIELKFANSSGWGLCVELGDRAKAPNTGAPMLLALSFGPSGTANAAYLDLFHISALDSIIPSDAEQFYPGPIMEYSYPRGKKMQAAIKSMGINAAIFENDAQAGQALIDREYKILETYAATPMWKEAWLRYYRLIYRDSYDRISDAAGKIALNMGASASLTASDKRVFASKALAFVQGFTYERDLSGSDFVDLVSAVTQNRGDCDSRAMLWAIILSHADIKSAMMVSQQHSHAMGLADIEGSGARFAAYGTRWLVAETTADVDIGLIAQDMSDTESWLGIIFD
ncbi:MAG: hypothetical protein LBH16_02210 [Treponema sp.]|jgi:hypothetical protein|nr:hypothetical protein [Treponema sp.]